MQKRRLTRLAGRTLALCLFALALGAPVAQAQCGQRTSADPRHWSGGGRPPLAIGDSVLYDAVPDLARHGFHADGMICRTMGQGLALLRASHATLPHLVLLALGTNGYLTSSDIRQALDILGPGRVLALVTPHHGDLPGVPSIIRSTASHYRSQIIVLDWDRLSRSHPGWFAPDGIHLGGPAGIAGYTSLVASVLPYAPAPCAS